MNGIWFAAMVAFLVVAGVAAQLGWQLPQMPAVKRVLLRSRTRADQDTETSTNPSRPPTHQPRSAAVAEPQ